MIQGSLTFVGTGLTIAGQVTQEALSCIEDAEKLFYLASNVTTSRWIESLNPSAESLHDAYRDGKPREQTYAEMVERILAAALRRAATSSSRSTVTRGSSSTRRTKPSAAHARQATKLRCSPGISAEDCLFADLGVDPGERGCQSFEATDFLLRRRIFDPTSTLVLWQIGGIGVFDFHTKPLWSRQGLEVLERELLRHYAAEHEVVIYEAVPYPTLPPKILRIPLAELAGRRSPSAPPSTFRRSPTARAIRRCAKRWG